MPYLIAAVLLLGALTAVNLLLTVGVIRRLREHTEILSGQPDAFQDGIVAAGESPAPFSAVATDGSPVRLDDLDGPALFAFFSPNCKACHQKLPDFRTEAAAFPGGRDRVFAVVARDGGDMAEMADALSGVARVIVETDRPVITEAFQVKGFPAWAMVEGGTVLRSTVGMDRLPSPVAA